MCNWIVKRVDGELTLKHKSGIVFDNWASAEAYDAKVRN